MSLANITLNNGVQMPALGLGVYQSKPGEETYRAVRIALESGYRLIDTAACYENEQDVGRAIRDSEIKREDLFITTKLWKTDQGPKKTTLAFETSLKKLALDYLDLYLIHWPVRTLRVFSWQEIETIYQKRQCRAIGVSNYMPQHLNELKATARIQPMINQVEFSPFLYQQNLLSFCRAREIHLQAYAPLTRATRLDHLLLQQLAQKHYKSPAQIMLRWCIQQDVSCVPKSIHPIRIQENFSISDFVLSQDEMQQLNALNENLRTCWDPTYIA